MADWKAAEAQDEHDFLYAEEANANEGASMRLPNIRTRQTVRDLNKAIATSLNNPAGWETLAVAHVNTELDELDRTLSSYGVHDTDTIFFTRSVTPQEPPHPPAYSAPKTLDNLFFKDLDGRTLTLHGVPLTFKVSQLKKKLGVEKALDVEEVRMLWGGKQLEDGTTLFDYSLGEHYSSGGEAERGSEMILH
ncbi:hypothetical protein VTL71DRAFT_2055 [Oculimacula yallundae]|uniref:Ubiquitin-like domain-containing protein n=1 Tax=Oculimacula yallundae TaxID=86028 RepID=A0ABR4C7X0_9HELO